MLITVPVVRGDGWAVVGRVGGVVVVEVYTTPRHHVAPFGLWICGHMHRCHVTGVWSNEPRTKPAMA